MKEKGNFVPSVVRLKPLNIMPGVVKRNCEVYYRILPAEDTQWDLIKTEESTLYIRSTQGLSDDNTRPSKFWEFKCDGVFKNDSQDSFYSRVTDGLLQGIVRGYNGIIVAFGQTGAGKSFSLGGLHFSEQEFGIAPRVIFDLYKIKRNLPRNIKMNIQMSYTEFSKSSVVDLLKNYPNSIDPWHVKNASKIKVRSEYEALKVLYRGEGRKTFANNSKYMSHICSTVLTFHIITTNQDFSCPQKISSRLHIIDMAGVDSVGNISSDFKNPLDIGKANTIKSYLEQFMLFLMENIPSHIQVKERTNPLIYFLGKDLCNESILRFLGHIRIQKEDLKITISTLRFGQLARGLKPKIKEIKPDINEDIKLQYLQNRLENLQKEKIYYSVLMNQDLTIDLDQHRMEHIQRTVAAYLQNRITELNVLNVAEATEAFKVVKAICKVAEEEKSKISQENEIVVKTTRSKPGSRTSLKNYKSSSKRFKRLKDSVSSLDKAMPDSSNSKITTPPPPNASQLDSASTSTIPKKMSKQSSVIIQKKSTAGSSLRDKVESNYLTDTALIPNILPKYEKVWHNFTHDVKSTYNNLYRSYQANENDLKKVFIDYQREIEKLQSYKELVEKRRVELLEAQMFQQFISSHDCEEVITESEELYRENLYKARASLLEQQEAVLKLQSELKIYLNNRRELKEHLQEDFDQYCRDNYNLVFPDVGEEEEELILISDTINTELVSARDGTEDELEEPKKHVVINLDQLKKIMKMELQRNMKLREIKNRKWKNLC